MDELDVYHIVKAAIDTWNLYGLLPAAPPDEFDSEARKISKEIQENTSTKDIASVIARVCSTAFGESFSPESCLVVAKNIEIQLHQM